MGTRITFALTTLAALVLAAVLAQPSNAGSATRIYLPALLCPGCTGPSPTPAPGGYSAERLEVIRLVNEARIAAGCPATSINANLMRATQDWSVQMDTTGIYHHADYQWYVDHDYPIGADENIGISGTAEQIFSAWMESPAHKDNMLGCPYQNPSDPSYNPTVKYDIGVGYSNGYWVLALGTVFP